MKRAFFFLLAFVFPSVVFAQDYYVRPAGGSYGTEDGTSYANAWDGISNINWAAVDSGNGILYVDGTHTSGVTISVSGESGTPIHLKGYTPSASVRGINISSQNYITIEGMIVENDASQYCIEVSGNSDYVTIKNNILRGSYMGGIRVSSSGYPAQTTPSTASNDTIIEGNEIYNNGLGPPDRYTAGIYLYSYSASVRNNKIHDNGNYYTYDHGIYTGTGSGTFQIYGNSIYNHNYGRGIK